MRAAIEYAIDEQAQERDARPQGQHHEVHRGRVPRLGLRARQARVRRQVYTWEQWEKTKAAKGEDAANAEQKAALGAGKILIKDAIADITLQQVLTRPKEFDVIATLNLNGDYLPTRSPRRSAASASRPGGNINYVTGHAIFEATHGTAPKYAEPGQGEPRLGHPLRRDDAALPGLDRGRRPRSSRA